MLGIWTDLSKQSPRPETVYEKVHYKSAGKDKLDKFLIKTTKKIHRENAPLWQLSARKINKVLLKKKGKKKDTREITKPKLKRAKEKVEIG